jgi:hypothetical protein
VFVSLVLWQDPQRRAEKRRTWTEEKRKMKYDLELIRKAVSEAIAHAEQFKDTDDGGTCNFDACYIRVPGMRESTAREISGVSMMDTRWHGRTLHLHGTHGQANRRTAMAEAQRKFLEANYPQLSIGMYYQMD